jgi:hypothetical protein
VIASGVTISGSEFYRLFVVLSVGIVQLGSVVATRNSIGGHIARTLPVSYDGARLHPALFLGRECFGAAGLGVAAWLGQFVAILLRGSFGDVAWLTSRWELNSGFVLGPLPVTFLGIVWFVFVVQQMRQGPYHQAPHDRVARTLVVRLRASGSE